MRGRLLQLLIAALAGIVLIPASGASGQQSGAGLGIRLVEAPESARNDPRARVYIVDHVAPGTTFERRIEISNDTDRPLDPSLYVAPATLERGGFDIGARDDEGELVEWSTIEPSSLELDPRTDGTATLRISVPEDAEHGEYYGAALAEQAPPPGEGVRVASRVGIRIYLSVGDGEAPETDFDISTLTASRLEDGTPVVDAAVENTGGRALDVSGDLELDDGPGGVSAGPFPADIGTTLGIGASAPVRVMLDEELPDGPWRATLTMRSGEREKTVTGVITFPEPGEEGRPVEAEEQAAKRQWGFVAALLALLVLLLLLLVALRRRRRDEEGAAEHR
ncbi:MAG TPA: hypothetical protein VEA78_02125 [Acidimicrobiales bacterium]|nr:hypothetical protein [Acidimicrobiales bacterium]